LLRFWPRPEEHPVMSHTAFSGIVLVIAVLGQV
jgi:hypothetical protein